MFDYDYIMLSKVRQSIESSICLKILGEVIIAHDS